MLGSAESSDIGNFRRFRMTPAPYEKAQAFDVICKRAAHPGSKIKSEGNVVLKAQPRSIEPQNVVYDGLKCKMRVQPDL